MKTISWKELIERMNINIVHGKTVEEALRAIMASEGVPQGDLKEEPTK